ncbi:hypothetical protein [Carnobacterium divergens]|uniref:Uncharacterized protein n=1 Tax=Carnobacterium divergens TaxID=2748 RepID=A0A2R8A2G1_CARDV|nr:hypothetical protein [Carnobacterium divergens]MCO6017068.1 hypothetical protein [Carnobacterium divergens]MDT1940402.1 hypothetical protein [Carnobacterium divergens]MDT1942840.1 hypothetical protein [Carnobacterium divergens]MDT1948646.1 hypothetical protein [Carnobacterium divergens]MDT1951127.1 hypothetical protein [Carnobacterium divergens]
MSSLIGAYFFMFLGLFYIALIVGMFFMWYFIIKKAIVKGINESKLVKNSLEHDREIYLLKQELKGLKTAQQLTDTPKEEQVEKVEEISIKEEVPKEEIGEKGDREYDESSN